MYSDWSNFHTDMLLVKDNCHLYNATGTQVRHDCDLVFNFYEQELSKNVNKIALQVIIVIVCESFIYFFA